MYQTIFSPSKYISTLDIFSFKADMLLVIFKIKINALISYLNKGLRYLSIGFQTIMCYKVT